MKLNVVRALYLTIELDENPNYLNSMIYECINFTRGFAKSWISNTLRGTNQNIDQTIMISEYSA
jgi:hypothetical protein